MVVVVGLFILVIVAMLLGGGIEWMLINLHIVIYVGLGLIVIHWLYSLIRDRYYVWRDKQDRLEAANRQIEAAFAQQDEERRQLRHQLHEDLKGLQALEDHIFQIIRSLSEKRPDDKSGDS